MAGLYRCGLSGGANLLEPGQGIWIGVNGENVGIKQMPFSVTGQQYVTNNGAFFGNVKGYNTFTVSASGTSYIGVCAMKADGTFTSSFGQFATPYTLDLRNTDYAYVFVNLYNGPAPTWTFSVA